jgi:hypothetical protein
VGQRPPKKCCPANHVLRQLKKEDDDDSKDGDLVCESVSWKGKYPQAAEEEKKKKWWKKSFLPTRVLPRKRQERYQTGRADKLDRNNFEVDIAGQ